MLTFQNLPRARNSSLAPSPQDVEILVSRQNLKELFDDAVKVLRKYIRT